MSNNFKVKHGLEVAAGVTITTGGINVTGAAVLDSLSLVTPLPAIYGGTGTTTSTGTGSLVLNTSPTFAGTVVGITAAMVGLANVDNTTDLLKPISTATQTALDLKANQSTTYTKTESAAAIQSVVGAAPAALATLQELGTLLATDGSAAGALTTAISLKAPIASPAFTGTVTGITSAMVGLANVDNTTDLLKPISTATQTALDLKAPIASPAFTGTVTGITSAMVGLGNVANTTDLLKPISTATQTALDLKAPIASPAFTGTVTGITSAMVGLANVDNTTDLLKPISTATQTALDLKANQSTTYTKVESDAAIQSVVGAAPAALATLQELETLLATDGSAAGALTTAISLKAPIASPTFTGTVAGITPAMVGLGNVDNTSDLLKPISTATQTALDLKASLASPTFTGTVTGITSAMVGLDNVANTTDLLKPISTATQTALDLKAPQSTTYTKTESDVAIQTVVSAAPAALATLQELGTLLATDGSAAGALTTAISLKAPIASPAFTGTVTGITSAMVGLGNVANTTDALKPISTATQTALDLKANQSTTYTKVESDAAIQSVVGAAPAALATLQELETLLATDGSAAGALTTAISLKAPIASPAFTGTVTGITSAMVGLGNVDNTSDLLKPISTATQTALDLKASLASPTFTGTVAGITPAMVGLGNVDNTSDLLKPISTATQTALELKASLASPAFTGTVTGITPAMVGLANVTNTTDLLKPISTATQTALDLKASLASPAFTGNVTGITATMVGLGNVDNTTDLLKPISTATQTALDLKASLASPIFHTAITTDSVAFDLINTTATTVNFAGAATTISIGSGLPGTTTVNNDLVVAGTITYGNGANQLSATNLSISDALIYLADDNVADTFDIGFIGAYNNGAHTHLGIVRDASDKIWKLFSGITTEPTATVDFTGAAYDDLMIGNLITAGVNRVTITAPGTSATLTLANGSTLTTVGSNTLSLTTTAATSVTLPTSGTLVNSAVTTLSSLASVGTITAGTWAGDFGSVSGANLTNVAAAGLQSATTVVSTSGSAKPVSGNVLVATSDSSAAWQDVSVLSGGGGSGTVSSVSGTGSVNGLTLSGTVTATGDITLGGTLSGVSLTTAVTGILPVANGGTGSNSVSGTGSVVLNTSPVLATSVLTESTSFALINTAATTVNFAGAATTISIGAGTGATTVNNNLVVSGTITYGGGANQLSATQLSVTDPLIFMASGNTVDMFDIGFSGLYNTTSYTGFVRDASDAGTWKLFNGLSVIPGTTVDFTNASLIYAPIKVGALSASTGTFSGALTASTGTFTSGFSATQYTSSVATGTAPFVVSSATPVTGLNIGGYSAALKSATTVVNVSAATAPIAGQVLKATSTSAATWQTLSVALGTDVSGILLTANGGTGTNTKTGTGSLVLSADPTFTGVPAAPTAAAGTSTTQLATTAFVTTADALKANLAGPTFTGVPAAPTATAGTNTTQVATTAFVLANAISAASPTFTGVPAAPTATAGTNTTQLATTAFVTTADALKANLAGPTFTGVPAAPTATAGTNTTQVATTAFVLANSVQKATLNTVTNTISDGLGNLRSIPFLNQTAAYTLVAADNGRNINITTGGITIPTASIFVAGDVISVYNQSGTAQNITWSAGTMYLAGTTTAKTSPLSLLGRGCLTIMFVIGGAAPEMVVSGNV